MSAPAQQRPALLAHGQEALAQQRFDEAFDIANQLLERHPQDPQALILRVNACNGSGRLDAVIDALGRLLQVQPRPQFVRMLAAAHNRRGSRALESGRANDALADFDAAIAIDPSQPHAPFNAALALHRTGRTDAALDALRRHLQQYPDDQRARLQLIDWLLPGSPEQAAEELSAGFGDAGTLPADIAAALARVAARCGDAALCLGALQVRPADGSLQRSLDAAHALDLAGNLDGARRVYRHAAVLSGNGQRSPGLIADIGSRLGLPAIPASTAHIDDCRAGFARGLDALDALWTEARLAPCEPGLDQLRWSNFLLAYHGRDNRELQSRYGQLLQRAVGRLAPLPDPQAPVAGRIGLVSSFFRDCTVAAYFGCWIDWLREAGHEVHVYQLGPRRDAVTEQLAQQASVFRFEPASVDRLAATLQADRLQMILYPELGMDARLLPLAAQRIAPRQLAGWGHPDTSGLPTIDGWLTCGPMEPDDAARHYRERLLPLPGLGVDYRRPRPPAPVDRASLGLPDAAFLMLMPQSLFKWHPDTDAVVAAILAARPQARLVLFEPEVPQWKRQLLRRLHPAFDAAGADPDALLWLPLCDRQRYLQINQACDLMLDCLHWSGGNTSLDALVSGLPVLTCPGRFMRGRQSLAMLDRLGLAGQLACDDADRLAGRALELIDRRDERDALGRTILDRLDSLFDAHSARAGFADHVRTILDEATC